jgi:hypothetical protein
VTDCRDILWWCLWCLPRACLCTRRRILSRQRPSSEAKQCPICSREGRLKWGQPEPSSEDVLSARHGNSLRLRVSPDDERITLVLRTRFWMPDSKLVFWLWPFLWLWHYLHVVITLVDFNHRNHKISMMSTKQTSEHNYNHYKTLKYYKMYLCSLSCISERPIIDNLELKVRNAAL